MFKKKRLIALLGVCIASLLSLGLCFLNGATASAEAESTPILWSISDAVKPNETVVIQGYGLQANDLAEKTFPMK